MSWSRTPQPRQLSARKLGQETDKTLPSDTGTDQLRAQVEDLEWRDRWNTERIERLGARLVKTEIAACELAEQLERVRAERDILLRSLLKASLEARP